MPSRTQVEQALRTHFEAWNEGDRARWIANWNDDVEMQDPVGGPKKKGIGSVEKSWDRSFQDGHRWHLTPVFMSICEDQAAVHVRNAGTLNGVDVVLDSIEIYWIGDDGKVARVQTYFSSPDGQALDPYFTGQES